MTDAPAPLPTPPGMEPPPPDPVIDPVGHGGERRWLPIAGALGFLVLAVAIYWVWDNPQELADAQELHGLAARVVALEQRPPPDLGALETRLAALEKRAAAPPVAAAAPAAAPAPPAAAPTDMASKTELTQLATRLDAVNARADQLAALLQTTAQTDTQHLDAVEGKMDALAKQDTAATALTDKVTAAAQHLDALDGKVADLIKHDTATDATVGGAVAASTQRLAALDGKVADLSKQAASDAALPDTVKTLEQRIAALEKSAGGLPALTNRAAQLARLQAAASALEAGEPLGPLPGAPPELTRYATAKPPTLTGLKLAFPAAMQAAEEASIPSPAHANMLNRMWDRVQGLVVVRQGDSVVVGNPAAGVLARANLLLDASDLAGAVQAVSGLSGPAADAMAPWLQSAKDLLAARQAMATLAAHA